jgi:hypothetical protein
MRTSGHGNDFIMVMVPLAVILGAGLMYFGGPEELLRATDQLVTTLANSVAERVSARF